MLVLSRKHGERIKIGDGPGAVWVQVVDIDRNRVRLGIVAPRETDIQREENLPASKQFKPTGAA